MLLAAWKEGSSPIRLESRIRRARNELLGLKAHEQGVRNVFSSAIRRMPGTPKRAHPRSVRRGGARGRLAARVARAAGPGKRDRGRAGLADNFIRSGSPGRATRSTATSGPAGASSTSTASTRSAAGCTSPRAGSTPRLPGPLDWLRRYSQRLIAMWEQGDVLVTPTLARRAAGRRGDRGAARARSFELACRVQLEAVRPGQPGARSPPPERLPPLVRPRRPPAWR